MPAESKLSPTSKCGAARNVICTTCESDAPLQVDEHCAMIRPRDQAGETRTQSGRSDSSYSVFGAEAAPDALSAFFHRSAHDLYDVIAPVSQAAVGWTAFGGYDCEALERAWQARRDRGDNERTPEQARIETVLVGVERLHQVDVAEMTMRPVYWPSVTSSTATTGVIRSLWFHADGTPCRAELSDALEGGYASIRPWTSAYEAEIRSAEEIGGEAEAKLRVDIGDRSVVYRDGETAWTTTDSLPTRIASTLMSIGRRRSPVVVRRGYTFAETPTPQTPTDLILVVHGIGQKLAETSPGWTFTNAVNRLRLLMHEQRRVEEVASLLREGYCPQVLPVNWRTAFDPDKPNQKFSLGDITIDAIPAVRDLLAKVALDVPYFMSHHRPLMVAAVVGECNRLFRLWVEHNPDFSGRVHIVGHSLGSAISFEILSRQPTDVNRSSLYDSIARRFTSSAEAASEFEFNTHNLFCCGAPAPFFLLLMDRNLVPRSGCRSWDKKLTRPARYGSLAMRNIYNVYYMTDPVAYRLAPAVDSSFAQSLPPTSLQSVKKRVPEKTEKPTAARLPSAVELDTHDFAKETTADGRLFLLNENGQIDYVLPQQGGVMGLENQYLSMLYAHQAYWDSKEFARLIVVECGRPEGKEATASWLRGHKREAPVAQAIKRLAKA